MAMIWMSGGELGISELDAGGSIVASPYNGLSSRSGVYYYALGNQTFYKILPADYTELFAQVAWHWRDYGGDGDSFRLYYGGTVVVAVKFNFSTRYFDLYVNGVVVGTGPLVVLNRTWYLIELHVIIADVGGLVEFRVDGNPMVTFSGDTKAPSVLGINRVGSYVGPGSSYGYDDFIVNDPSGDVNNSWPGGLKIALRKPISEGAPQQWVPTPGPAHYTALDETPPSGADYVKTDTVDAIEKVQLSALPEEAQSVRAVQLDCRALKTSMIAPTRLALIAELGGTDYVQATQDLPLAQGQIKTLLNTNPAGGNWSVAAANALILGAQAKE